MDRPRRGHVRLSPGQHELHPVTGLDDEVGDGPGPRQVIADYPQLVDDDVLACLRYAARLADERFLPLRRP
jgi:hypothetical protein